MHCYLLSESQLARESTLVTQIYMKLSHFQNVQCTSHEMSHRQNEVVMADNKKQINQ